MTDFTELKKKHRVMWALGEYDRLADGLTISTDQTLRVARPRPGERVLDLATGTGITAIAARERGADVTGLDLTPELLAVARDKAKQAGYSDIDFQEGDARHCRSLMRTSTWCCRPVVTCSRRISRRSAPNLRA